MTEATEPRDLDWEREELILACDLVVQNGWRQVTATDQGVTELSQLLRRLPLHPEESRRASFRSVNSVARKAADFVTNLPTYQGRSTRGGEATKRVLSEFLSDEFGMRRIAREIRAAEASGVFVKLQTPVPEESRGAVEGRLLIRHHVTYERNNSLRKRKIAAAYRSAGILTCEVCGFNFEQFYGERGKGYIECHHLVPLYVAGVSTSKLNDLALLCSNCHRMIHAKSPWLTPTQLRSLIAIRPG